MKSSSRAFVSAGARLSVDEAKILELTLQRSDAPVATHLKLLGFYDANLTNLPGSQFERQQQIIWLIQSCPSDEIFADPSAKWNVKLYPELYKEAEEAWMNAFIKRPIDLATQLNAAEYIMEQSPDMAGMILARALASAPYSFAVLKMAWKWRFVIVKKAILGLFG